MFDHAIASDLLPTIADKVRSHLCVSEEIQFVPLSERNAVFRVQERYSERNLCVVRFFPRHARWLVRRLVLVPRLLNSSEVRAPQVLFFGRARASLFLAFEYVAGTPVDCFAASAILDYHDIVTAIHKTDVQVLQGINRNPFRKLDPQGKVSSLTRWVTSSDSKRMIAHAEALFDSIEDEKIVLCHGDLTPSNIMLSGSSSWAIDWTETCLSYPSAEWAHLIAASAWGGKLGSTLRVPDQFWERVIESLHERIPWPNFLCWLRLVAAYWLQVYSWWVQDATRVRQFIRPSLQQAFRRRLPAAREALMGLVQSVEDSHIWS